jgi:outer membrane protein OmpU
MKKVLFATTALVAFAGAAAAEVKISGSAEMGISGGDAKETLFHQSVDVRFAMTGETDGGLSFGATIDLEDSNDRGAACTLDADDAADIAALAGDDEFSFRCSTTDTIDDRGVNPDYTVFIKGAFGTLTMGDTDGALDWALTETAMLTSIADDHTSHGGYNGNGNFDSVYNGQVARYEYSFGAFAVAASAELDETGVDDANLGLGVKWSGDMGGAKLSLGLGMHSFDVASVGYTPIGVSAKVSANGFDAIVNYVDWDAYLGNDSYASIGLGYTTGALSMTVNTGVVELTGGGESKGWGAAVNYDLGGGATAMAGFGDTDGGSSTWSLGLGLAF